MTPTTGEKLSFSLCKPCFKNGVRIQHLSIWASQMIRQWQRQGYQTKEKEVGRACWNIPVAYWKFLWLTTFCPWRTLNFAHVLRSLNFGLTWCSAKVKTNLLLCDQNLPWGDVNCCTNEKALLPWKWYTAVNSLPSNPACHVQYY